MAKKLSWEEIVNLNNKRELDIARRRANDYEDAIFYDWKEGDLINAFEQAVGFGLLQELTPKSFYQKIFNNLPLETEGIFERGKYHAIIQAVNFKATKLYKKYQEELKNEGVKSYKNQAFRKVKSEGFKFVSTTFNLYKDCNFVDEIIKHNDNDIFFFLSPISYVDSRRLKDNARHLYALEIEIDNLVVKNNIQTGFFSFLKQTGAYGGNWIPQPTLISWSGKGVHLLYVLKEPVSLFPSNARSINKLRKALVRRIWNSSVTTSYKVKDIQFETLWQGFRMVGTPTKRALKGEAPEERCRGFLYKEGKEWTLEELFSFCSKEDIERIKKIEEKPSWTLEEMRQRYGEEWVKEHYTPRGKWKGIEPKFWTVNKAFYESFKAKIYNETEEGKRYHSLTMLCSVGWKCGVPQAVIEADAFDLMKHFNQVEERLEDLTEEDVYDALKYLKLGNKLHKFKNEYLTENAGLTPYEANKRNGRKRKEHFKYVDAIRAVDGKAEWNKMGGRPSKKEEVERWQQDHPQASQYRCQKETGIDKKTIRKYWVKI